MIKIQNTKKFFVPVLLAAAVLLPTLCGCSGSRISQIISGFIDKDEENLEFSDMQANVMELLNDFSDPVEVSIVGSDISIPDDAPDMTLRQLVSSYNWRIVMGSVEIPAEGNRFILKSDDGSMLYILEDLDYMILRYSDGSTQLIQTDDLQDYSLFEQLGNWVMGLDDDMNPVFSGVEISSATEHRTVALDSLTQPVGSTIELIASPTPSDTEISCNWSSDDNSVATVDEDGVVTCIAAGTCVITLNAYDPISETSATDTISVTVFE